MSADLLRRAAEAMRREGDPFLNSVAALIETGIPYASLRRPTSCSIYVEALAVAEQFLADPGDLPEVPE
jgi:hypothetical protein